MSPNTGQTYVAAVSDITLNVILDLFPVACSLTGYALTTIVLLTHFLHWTSTFTLLLFEHVALMVRDLLTATSLSSYLLSKGCSVGMAHLPPTIKLVKLLYFLLL